MTFLPRLGFILLLPAVSQAADTEPARQINWAINTAPPFHIVSGEYRQQGICDVLIDTVHRYLPELKLLSHVMPQPRIGRALERAENLCFPCMIHKTQGKQGAYYSEPTHVYPPHQIISSKHTAALIKSKYPLPVPLAHLLANDALNFGYPAGRRYGVLQPLIEGQDNRPGNRLVRSGDNGPIAILQMISSERIDYTIDYSITKRYYELTSGNYLELLPIAENNQQPVLGAIGCSNNAWGQSVIRQIDAVMPEIRNDIEFQQSLKFWFEQSAAIPYMQYNNLHLPPLNR